MLSSWIMGTSAVWLAAFSLEPDDGAPDHRPQALLKGFLEKALVSDLLIHKSDHTENSRKCQEFGNNLFSYTPPSRNI
jgi:hypothetical protein